MKTGDGVIPFPTRRRPVAKVDYLAARELSALGDVIQREFPGIDATPVQMLEEPYYSEFKAFVKSLIERLAQSNEETQ